MYFGIEFTSMLNMPSLVEPRRTCGYAFRGQGLCWPKNRDFGLTELVWLGGWGDLALQIILDIPAPHHRQLKLQMTSLYHHVISWQ
jgi:hypothetical protein